MVALDIPRHLHIAGNEILDLRELLLAVRRFDLTHTPARFDQSKAVRWRVWGRLWRQPWGTRPSRRLKMLTPRADVANRAIRTQNSAPWIVRARRHQPHSAKLQLQNAPAAISESP